MSRGFVNTRLTIAGLAAACVAISAYVIADRRAKLSETREEIAAMRLAARNSRTEDREARWLQSLIEAREREVERLRSESVEPEQGAGFRLGVDLGARDGAYGAWLERIGRLARFLVANDSYLIPELEHLTVNDWLDATLSESLETEADYRVAAANLRELAKRRVAPKLSAALAEYLDVFEGELPSDPMALAPFLDKTISSKVLERYRINPSGKIPHVRVIGAKLVLVEDRRVDTVWDSRFTFGTDGSHGFSRAPAPDLRSMREAIGRFQEENGREPVTGEELEPYVEREVYKDHLDETFRAMHTPVRSTSERG